MTECVMEDQPKPSDLRGLNHRCDALVVGGGLGGVAAALGACEMGARVILCETTSWLGGQLTSQMVPPDEHPWIESFGATELYRSLRSGIRSYYRQWYPLTESSRLAREFNPGSGRVSKLCHEPRVALATMLSMLAPFRMSKQLAVFTETVARSAEMESDRIGNVTLQCLRTGDIATVSAKYVIDATETGDFLRLAGVEYSVGAESAGEYGEAHAPSKADARNIQGFTVCFAIDACAGEDHTIEKPQQYDRWRLFVPQHWGGPLLSFAAPDPRTLRPTVRQFRPNDPSEGDGTADQSKDPGDKELWSFRRILHRKNFRADSLRSDVTLVNWPMNDYFDGAVIDVEDEVADTRIEAARQLSLSLLYWLQTEAPRWDGGTGHPELRLRPDISGTADGLAKAPYHRESRRILARQIVTETDVSLESRRGAGSRHYADSVGVGSYRIDLHPSTGGDTYIDIPSLPFEIPMGSLIPIRVRNLLPGSKNIGTTHIANGCYRLHPVEWNVGEVSGRLAGFCARERADPVEVYEKETLREEFLRSLDRAGVQRYWPRIEAY